MQDLHSGTQELLRALGHDEEPLGVFYAPQAPEGCFAPKKTEALTESMGEGKAASFTFDRANFSCILGNIWLARKKRGAACVAADRYGCLGGSFYSAFPSTPAQENWIAHYVSSGFPGMRGERYLKNPEGMRRFLDAVRPPKAPDRYCVIKPLSLFKDGEHPLLVSFFTRPEALSGLLTLAVYATNDYDVAAMPFGSGCANILAWPLRYLADGKVKAVVGGQDLSCRKFLKTDELSFTVSISLYESMLECLPESALYGDTWAGVRKKVLRSIQAWS